MVLAPPVHGGRRKRSSLVENMSRPPSRRDAAHAIHPLRRKSVRAVPRAVRIARVPDDSVNVTRAEYNRVIAILNERNIILNGLREAIARLESVADVQFKRIAQMQAELDDLRRVTGRNSSSRKPQ
jgi:hypothetical protein